MKHLCFLLLACLTVACCTTQKESPYDKFFELELKANPNDSLLKANYESWQKCKESDSVTRKINNLFADLDEIYEDEEMDDDRKDIDYFAVGYRCLNALTTNNISAHPDSIDKYLDWMEYLTYGFEGLGKYCDRINKLGLCMGYALMESEIKDIRQCAQERADIQMKIINHVPYRDPLNTPASSIERTQLLRALSYIQGNEIEIPEDILTQEELNGIYKKSREDSQHMHRLEVLGVKTNTMIECCLAQMQTNKELTTSTQKDLKILLRQTSHLVNLYDDLYTYSNSVLGHDERKYLVGTFTAGRRDSLWFTCDSEDGLVWSIHCSNPAVKPYQMWAYCPAFVSEGDLDGDGTEDFGILNTWATSNCRSYCVYTLRSGQFRYMLPPLETTYSLRASGHNLVKKSNKPGYAHVIYSDMEAEQACCNFAPTKDTLMAFKYTVPEKLE